MKTDFSKVDRLVDAAMKAGLTSLGNDVRRRAMILAPFDNDRKEGKHLRETGQVDVTAVSVNGGKKDDSVTISFNTDYARRRHYENNLHPSTRLYLTNALKSITNLKKYFKEVF